MFTIPTPIILFVGLTLITCVIAYWSDNLGKKLGKKRISLFGLRPRQTATLITMFSSVAIMLLTLAGLTAFSSQVQDALLNSQGLRARTVTLRADVKRLTDTTASLTARANASRARAAEANRKARLAISSSNAITRRADSNVALAKQKIAATTQKLGRAQFELTAAERSQKEALRGEQSERAQAGQAEAQLLLARGKLNAAQSDLKAINEQLNTARQNVQHVRDTLARIQAGTKIDLARFSLQRHQLELGRVRVDEMTRQQGELQTKIQAMQGQVNAYQVELAGYDKLSTTLAMGKVDIDIGQAFGEVVVPPGADPADVRSTILRLLESGSQAAIKLGGEPYVNPDTGIKRALHLASLPGPNGAYFNESQIIENFINYLQTLSVPVSVRLVSFRRYMEGEHLFEARLVAVPVRRLYVQGETLAQMNIDGSQDDARVFNQLLALVEKGGAAAREKGVNPLLSDKNPDFFAAGTNERIFETLRALQTKGGVQTVSMIAAEDVFTVDSPVVRFVIEPSSG